MLSFLTIPEPPTVQSKPMPVVQTYRAQSHGRTIESRLHLSHLAAVVVARLMVQTYGPSDAATV
jgi:hypothetical protein